MRKQIGKKFVITGGGSGGHMSVAVALIDELRERYSDVDDNLLFIGSDLIMDGQKGESFEKKRMEEKKVKFVSIRGGKLQRQLTFQTIPLLFRTILGFIDAYRILKKFKPELVFSVGGYVSVPVGLVAHFMKIPIYLHEQTAAVGLSNKIVGRYAKKIYIAFPQSSKYFNDGKTIHVGNVVRKDIFKKDGNTELTQHLKEMIERKSDLPIIYFSGGGLGSHVINITVRQMLQYLLHNFQVILQTGDNPKTRDYDVIYSDWKSMPEKFKSRLHVTKFVTDEEIGSVFTNADMFVGRSGANTVYELGTLGIPAILIPIPWVTHNEQELNAEILKDLGQAIILPEGELTPEKLTMTIEKFWERIQNGLKIDKKKASKIFTQNALDTIILDIFG